MKQRTQSISVLLAVLWSFTLFLTACANSSSAPSPSTSTPPSSVAGDFLGPVPGINGGIVLSSNGQMLLAYVCNGTSVVHWFQGSLRANGAEISAASGLHLRVSLTEQAASGQLTLSTGQVVPFTASRLPAHTEQGLYRGEETFHGVRYLGGWVYDTAVSVLPTHLAFVAVGLPSLAPASTPTPFIKENAIENEQTGAILSPPALTPQDVASRSVVVPGLGVFHLTYCQLATCH